MTTRTVSFTCDVKGRYGTRKYHEYKANVPYRIETSLLNAIEATAGKKLWQEVAEKSILKKSVNRSTKKDISTVSRVDKASITKQSVKK